MAFSYTDDAIVSASPTGRHLSTVIKRPVVLMSGWNEHAEAICKVLNDLQPDHPVSNMDVNPYEGLSTRGFLGKSFKAAADTLSGNWPKAKNFSKLEGIALNYVNNTAYTVGGDKVTANESALLDCLHEKQDRVTELYGQLKMVTAELEDVTTQLKAAEEKLAKPVEVSGNLAQAIFSCVPGVQILSNNRKFKRV